MCRLSVVVIHPLRLLVSPYSQFKDGRPTRNMVKKVLSVISVMHMKGLALVEIHQ